MNNKTFYVLGDSVIKGVIFDEARSRYALLKDNCATVLSKLLDITIINRAKMGCTVSKGKEILLKDLEKGIDCEAAVLEFGGNDCDFTWGEVSSSPETVHFPKTTLETFHNEMTSMVDILKGKNIVPVLMNLPPIDSDRYFDFISQGLRPENILKWLGRKDAIHDHHAKYSSIVDTISKAKDCILIDVRSSFMAQNDYRDFLCRDGIHPNEKGHKLIQDVFMGHALP